MAIHEASPGDAMGHNQTGDEAGDFESTGGLEARYRGYLACLNRRAWSELHQHLDEGVSHNGRLLGITGYRRMLEEDVEQIPDLRFTAELLVVQPPTVAARLGFDCAPRNQFMGFDVDGRRVTFVEHVFYRFERAKIEEVWSVVDTAAIERQLQIPTQR